MRCNQCNKFVSFDQDDPQVDDIAISEGGEVHCEARIVLTCTECSQELKEASLEMNEPIELGEHEGGGHALEIDESGAEATQRSGNFDKKTGEFIPSCGRYAKTFYGASVNYTVTCECGHTWEGTLEDDVQASSMDEC